MNQILQKDFSLEYLIRLSGEKQISKALEFGIKNGLNRVGIIISEEKKDKIVKILGQPTNPKVGNKNFIIEYFEINDINNKIETQKRYLKKLHYWKQGYKLLISNADIYLIDNTIL